MKKYLPSADELISGVIVVIVALTAWSFLQPSIAKLTAKITPKAS